MKQPIEIRRIAVKRAETARRRQMGKTAAIALDALNRILNSWDRDADSAPVVKALYWPSAPPPTIA